MIGANVRGEREFFEAIDRAIDVIEDVRRLPEGWQPHVDVYVDHEIRHLDTLGAGGWIPNTSEYEARKLKEVGSKPQMQYSGKTYKSLTGQSAGFVRIESANSLHAGSSNPLARYHHEGRGRLPERLMIVITDGQKRDHQDVFVDSYSDAFEAIGFKVL